jgi:2-polyprenyl-6-methoxyphenol hydroxylase-like FAD-dependent oxidoreductase
VNGQDDEVEVPVLIVGGSLVGLSTALFLASHGVESLVVERHATRRGGWASASTPTW